jgi:hypothetical protein
MSIRHFSDLTSVQLGTSWTNLAHQCIWEFVCPHK